MCPKYGVADATPATPLTPSLSNPDRVVTTNIDRECQIKAIRAKIRSLEEVDTKQIHILDYIKSDSFKDRVSNKILSMARGSLDEKLGGKQDENQENRGVSRLG